MYCSGCIRFLVANLCEYFGANRNRLLENWCSWVIWLLAKVRELKVKILHNLTNFMIIVIIAHFTLIIKCVKREIDTQQIASMSSPTDDRRLNHVNKRDSFSLWLMVDKLLPRFVEYFKIKSSTHKKENIKEKWFTWLLEQKLNKTCSSFQVKGGG